MEGRLELGGGERFGQIGVAAKAPALDAVVWIAGGGDDDGREFPKVRRIAGPDVGKDLGSADFRQAKIEQENHGTVGIVDEIAAQKVQCLLAVGKPPDRPGDSDPLELPLEELEMAFIIFRHENDWFGLHITPIPIYKRTNPRRYLMPLPLLSTHRPVYI